MIVLTPDVLEWRIKIKILKMLKEIVMKTFIIKPRPPFSITLHLKKFCPKNLPVPCIFKENSCRRMILIRDKLIPYKLTVISEGENPKLRLEVFTGSNRLAEKILERVKEIYRADFDYKKFLNKCRLNKQFYTIAKKYYGLRPTRMVSIYEALIDSIIEQNISLNLALRIKSNFVKEFGERRIINKEEFYSFPLPEKISKLKAIELKREIRTTLAKANTIIEVARISKSLPKEEEIEENPEDFIEFITKIKGIGKWTAQISIAKISKKFYVGPYGDLAVKRGFKKILDIEDEEEIEKFSKNLEEYAGLILYLMALEGHQTLRFQHFNSLHKDKETENRTSKII